MHTICCVLQEKTTESAIYSRMGETRPREGVKRPRKASWNHQRSSDHIARRLPDPALGIRDKGASRGACLACEAVVSKADGRRTRRV
jgi:hypothetical protein